MRSSLLLMLAGSLVFAGCSGSNGISHISEPEITADAGQVTPDGGEPDALPNVPSVTAGADSLTLETDADPGASVSPGSTCSSSAHRYYLYLGQSSLESWSCNYEPALGYYAPRMDKAFVLTSEQRARIDAVLATLKAGLAPMTCDDHPQRTIDVSRAGAVSRTYYGSDYECGRGGDLAYVRVSLAPLEALFAEITPH